MPRRSVRTSRRTGGALTVVIVLLALAAAILACAIVIREKNRPAEEPVAVDPAEDFVNVNDPPRTEIVLKSDLYNEELLKESTGAAATSEPEATPTPTPAPEETDPNAGLRPGPAGMNMLPIFKKAYTDEKVIAITLDECSSVATTQKFIELAQRHNAKLTLFPTGENVMKNGMDAVLKRCVFQLGYEIENRGYSALAKLFQQPTNLMVQEIWKQSMALNYALGVKYEPHFYRMYGGLGETDLRTHAYLMQEGYLGIAHWTVSGSDVPAFKMDTKLTPGGIYSFKTIEADGERMAALMMAANSMGYKMVTLNELFGYPANAYAQAEGSLLSEKQPDFQYDDTALSDIYPGEASWAVYRMQGRLTELGYLVGSEPDGIFGEATSEALRLFQAEVGKAASGAGDVGTLKRLYAADAPINPNPIIIVTPTPGPGELWVENTLIPSVDFAAAVEKTE